MNIINAQREMRSNFLGGFAGQLVSGTIWLVSSAISVLSEPRIAMAMLFIGSMFIFPLTQGLLRMLGRPAKVSSENGLWALGSQTAFTVPINFLLVGAATLHRQDWFFPASMIVVGAHYLPFVTLYGMKMFAVLAALLVLAGAGFAIYFQSISYLAGWLAAFLLILFAFIGRQLVLNEEKKK